EESQDAQVILGDALRGITDEADDPGGEIVPPAGEIMQGTVSVGVERVDGEIAPRGILGPVRSEGDLRVASVGGDVAPQGGDLEAGRRRDRGDGAMLDPGRHGLDLRLLQATN